MKYYLYFICACFTLNSCYFKPTKFEAKSRLDNGYYRSGNGFSTTFFEVNGDTAYADFILIDKFPRELESDTLYYNAASQSWKSDKSQLAREGKIYRYTSVYTCNTCSVEKEYNIRSELKKDKKLTRQYIDSYKNYAAVNEFHSFVIRQDTLSRINPHYYELKEKVSFFSNLNTISHAEFLKEFAKFKKEVIKK
ncbi:MAG: hypothetical protein ACTHMC_25570 [Pseudobacter sp.]|uniref:hypothetical protein n=1 Tax=Pseudobacter sp. TaxID=2045420 RepID=UPI003F7EF157